MANQYNQRLANALHALEELDRASVQDETSRVFVEVRDTGTREVTVRGNVQGLVALAVLLLDLAASPGFAGRHVHVDEAGIADHCDRDLVLAYVPASWDSGSD